MKSNQIQQRDDILRALANGAVPPRVIEQALAGAGTPLPRTSLNRALHQLISNGLVVSEGSGRARVYRLARDPVVTKWFSTPFDQRPPMPFARARIDAYEPNKTRWLTPAQHAAMEAEGRRDVPASTHARAIARRFMVDIAYASSSLEGNTYSWAEARALIEDGLVAPGRRSDETVMIENHKRAAEFVVEIAAGAGLYGAQDGVDKRTVRDVHYLLSDGLVQPHARGAIRSQPVSIGGSCYVPESAPQVLDECLGVICTKAEAVNDPFEKSLFLMTALSYLQPFIDVNKRTGRLVANVPLIASGRAPLSFLGANKRAYTDGLIQFYELGDPTAIADAFTQTWLASARKYEVANDMSPERVAVMAAHRPSIKKALHALGSGELDMGGLAPWLETAGVPVESARLASEMIMEYLASATDRGLALDGYNQSEAAALMAISKNARKAVSATHKRTPRP